MIETVERIRDILPEVMDAIDARQRQHRQGVFAALAGFEKTHQNRSGRLKKKNRYRNKRAMWHGYRKLR